LEHFPVLCTSYHRAGSLSGNVFLILLGLDLSQDTGYPESSLDFPQSLLANAIIIPRSGHHPFLPNPFQCIIHRHSTIPRHSESVAKYPPPPTHTHRLLRGHLVNILSYGVLKTVVAAVKVPLPVLTEDEHDWLYTYCAIESSRAV
jgi:hypothetical protein